ncbi:uncharacterized protein LOC120746744 [Simochromis diagramma]|uniref:uncharacterized protein LOC120746744 n=1 Tax=Simochromis diagramma TaxID=43689 RepID=UPI001A7E355F|nr:uncharacterized protein LOC120746744 [Simochromis diagramma]
MIQRRQKYWLNWLTPGRVPHSCPRTFKTQRRGDRRSIGSLSALHLIQIVGLSDFILSISRACCSGFIYQEKQNIQGATTVLTQTAAAAGLHRMKMFGRMMSCCVALLLTFSSVSAVRRALNSITDLRSVGFGQSVPEQSLWLLRWFANEIDINGDISLIFDPHSGDYGSHHYRNDEQLLEPLPWGYHYYSLGNIHREGSLRLPHHVFQSEHEAGNRARIIIRVREQNVGRRTSQIIDRVYITQHYEIYEDRRTAYDPQHTYQVTTNLLTELRRFSFDRDNINLQSRRVVQENYSSHEYNRRPHDVLQSSQSCQNHTFVFSERYNSNLHFQSQDDNTCVYCFICAVVIVASLVFGLLYLSYSPK